MIKLIRDFITNNKRLRDRIGDLENHLMVQKGLTLAYKECLKPISPEFKQKLRKIKKDAKNNIPTGSATVVELVNYILKENQ